MPINYEYFHYENIPISGNQSVSSFEQDCSNATGLCSYPFYVYIIIIISGINSLLL